MCVSCQIINTYNCKEKKSTSRSSRSDRNAYRKKILDYIEPYFAEREFVGLSEELRGHTAATIKMDVVPWIKDYAVDINEAYSELTLEENKNTISGDESRILQSYKEIFDSSGSENKLDSKQCNPLIGKKHATEKKSIGKKNFVQRRSRHGKDDGWKENWVGLGHRNF